jgi:uncharacterized OB-fold protein
MAAGETVGVARPLPALNDDNRAFWTSGRDGVLAIHRCQACRYYVHPPVRFCPACESRSVEPEAVSGLGTVITYTVNHKAWLPGLKVPYVLALVAIDEQEDVRLPTNIVGVDPEAVRIGLRVQVEFEQVEEVWVPLFRPVAA